MKTVKQQIIDRRRELRLSQKRLSELSNIQPNSISYFENGHTMPTLDTITKLVEAMGGTLVIEWGSCCNHCKIPINYTGICEVCYRG